MSNVETAPLQDPRIVLTLDAGGTTFRFFATQAGETVAEIPPVPTRGDDLAACLASIVQGFMAIQARCPAPPVAISFAFPGPADYLAGIIGDLPNLPAFRGGVPLGPLLADRFALPVFINNDGALFAYGEAIGGFLPFVNQLLTLAGSARRYQNLVGLTLGTGFGGGLARAGELISGDNSAAGHVWLLRNKVQPQAPAELGVSIKAVRRVYAELAGLEAERAPDPPAIELIARGQTVGHRPAAVEAYRRMGEIAGDAAAQALTIFDGLVVVGGGLAKSGDLFLPAFTAAMNAAFAAFPTPLRRLGPVAHNLEDPEQRRAFCHGTFRSVPIPGTTRTVSYDPTPRTAVGLSRLGTSRAIALGAYAYAVRQLDRASPAR